MKSFECTDLRILSLFEVLRKYYGLALAGSIFSIILASVVYSGWPDGLLPNLSYPYAYSGDALSHIWMIQRILEGWIFENPRGGFPFGSNFSDYPNSDTGNFLLLKVIGYFGGVYYSVLNIYVLLTYALCFFFSFLVFCALRLQTFLAFALALIYSFTTFHLSRMGHLFYLAYFVVPIFFYFSLLWVSPEWKDNSSVRLRIVKLLGVLGAFVFLGSFGVYYAVFGCILLFLAFLYNLVNGVFRGNLFISFALFGVVLGVMLNMAPYWLYKSEHGANPQVAQRHVSHSEVYAFKLTHLVLPHSRHRVAWMSEKTNGYLRDTPFNNENTTAAIGVLGSVGLLCAALMLVRGISGRRVDFRVSFLIVALIVLFLFGTMGGLGSLFAMVVSPAIRGWNRISIFIVFATLVVLGVFLSRVFFYYFDGTKRVWLFKFFVLAVVFVGLYDQIPPERVFAGQMRHAQKNFHEDQVFFKGVENMLPHGAAVYQLPYISFPEARAVHQLTAYDQARGFLNTKYLHWSFAGMKGREGDIFYKNLAEQSLGDQLLSIRRLGFSGIFVNSLGYPDQGRGVISEISRLIGKGPDLWHANGSAFFKMSGEIFDVSDKSFEEIVLQAYMHQQLDWMDFGVMDFSKKTWPSLVAWTEGVGRAEASGRWSSGHKVHVQFKRALPNRFLLKIKARGLRKNDKGPHVTMRVGEKLFPLDLQNGYKEFSFVIADQDASKIVFEVKDPMSPEELGINKDVRKLGIGLSSIEIRPMYQ